VSGVGLAVLCFLFGGLFFLVGRLLFEDSEHLGLQVFFIFGQAVLLPGVIEGLGVKVMAR